jgi:nicotinamide-nucleotide amidase
MKYLVENRNHSKVVKEYEHYPQNNSYWTGRKLISERIEAWENSLPQFLKLACQVGKVRLRISAREQAGITEMAIEEYVVSLNLIINDIIVGYEEEETIEFLVGIC